MSPCVCKKCGTPNDDSECVCGYDGENLCYPCIVDKLEAELAEAKAVLHRLRITAIHNNDGNSIVITHDLMPAAKRLEG